jgi:hypothetical protein
MRTTKICLTGNYPFPITIPLRATPWPQLHFSGPIPHLSQEAMVMLLNVFPDMSCFAAAQHAMRNTFGGPLEYGCQGAGQLRPYQRRRGATGSRLVGAQLACVHRRSLQAAPGQPPHRPPARGGPTIYAHPTTLPGSTGVRIYGGWPAWLSTIHSRPATTQATRKGWPSEAFTSGRCA